MKFEKGKAEILRSAEEIIQLCCTAGVHQSAPHTRFLLLFPVPLCYFRPISRVRADFIADLHFAHPHLQGFTGDQHARDDDCDDLVGWANALANPRFTNDVKARLPTRLGRALKERVGKTCPGLDPGSPADRVCGSCIASDFAHPTSPCFLLLLTGEDGVRLSAARPSSRQRSKASVGWVEPLRDPTK